MEYKFAEDLFTIRDLLGLSQENFAKIIDVEQPTIARSETGETNPSNKLLELVYGTAFEKNIQLGKLKEMLYKETLKEKHKLLFHGAKSKIVGQVELNKGRENNDFGQGFYTGESYHQAISFVSNFDNSSIYFIDLDMTNLKCKNYKVDQDWMMTIAYFRGRLDEYKDNEKILKLVDEVNKCDYIIAPIADNRMFQLINSFIDGEITDEQCKHCLAATNLGYQYIFKTKKALENVKLLERCYIASSEKNYYKNIRSKDAKLGDDKVKLARRKYRGIGKYIDEILD